MNFLRDVTRAAKGLIAVGVDAGDRVVLACGTDYDSVVLVFASWTVRAVVVPVPPSAPVEQFTRILADSHPAAVVVETRAHAETVTAVRPGLRSLLRAWNLGPAEQGRDGKRDRLQDVAAPGMYMAATAVALRRADASPHDPAAVIYPSENGKNPAVALTHGNLLASAQGQLRRLRPLAAENPVHDGALFPLPLNGWTSLSLLAALVCWGVPLGFPARGTPLMDAVEIYSPGLLIANGTHLKHVFEAEHAYETGKAEKPGWDNLNAFNAAVEHAVLFGRGGRRGLWRTISHSMHAWLYARMRERLGGRVRLILCPGRVPDDLSYFFTGAGMPVVQYFGFTACSGPLGLEITGTCAPGTMGRLVPGMKVRFTPGGVMEAGGPAVASSYWRAPRESGAVFRDGWFTTGVAGALTPAGTLVLRGRPSAPTAPEPKRPTPRRASRGSDGAPSGEE
ncbi:MULTISPECIES: AMP-binding protein [unclassified Nocardiopsis]|uniref:AMP-binding protein n=1 Tax=Nocardiopsis TaxID=2013 RepID=UPI00387B7E91